MARKADVTAMSKKQIADVQREVEREISRFFDEVGLAAPKPAGPKGGAGRTGAKTDRTDKNHKAKDPERYTSSVQATWTRNRAQVRPHLVAAGVFVAGTFAYAAHQAGLPDVPLAVAGAALVGPAAVYAAYAHSRIPAHRRPWAAVCWISATAWLTAASVWMSWPVAAAWAVTHVALSVRWWREHRDGYPDLGTTSAPAEEPDGPATIPELWAANIGCQGGALDGSTLTLVDVTDRTEVYIVQLRPGRQTLSTAMASLDKIASGLRRPMRNLVLEEIPETGDTDDEGDPSQLRLTVVTKSPIKGKLILTEAPYRESGREVA